MKKNILYLSCRQMKKLFTLFLCITYTFVALGGSIFMHNCGENTVLSIYEKSSHEECPICNGNDKTSTIQVVCKSGACKDIEVKINQLDNELFSANKSEKFIIQPFIFERLWVDLSPKTITLHSHIHSSPLLSYCSNTDPPQYLLNCNFRN